MALSNTLLHPNATKMLSKDQQYIDLIVKDRPEWCRCVCVCVYARTWVCERGCVSAGVSVCASG